MNDSNRVRYMVLGTNQAIKTAGQYVRAYTDLADGQIAIINEAGLAFDNGTPVTNANTKFRFAVRNGTQLIYTPLLQGSKIDSSVRKLFSYARNQVTYIGYNTTTGSSIQTLNANDYVVNIYMREYDKAGSAGNIKFGAYHSDDTATQAEIAYGLCDNLITNYSREAHKDILFGRVYSGAVTGGTWTGNYNAWTVTRGSKYATADEAHGASVGDILNFAGLCFIVTEVTSATVVKLDLAWQHESGVVVWDDAAGASTLTVAADLKTGTLNNNAEGSFAVTGKIVYFDLAGQFAKGIMTNTTNGVTLYEPKTNAAYALGGGTAAAGGNWGIRFEGQNRPFAVQTAPYNKVQFQLQLQDFGTTTGPTYSVTAYSGHGNYEQIAWEEWWCQHSEGNRYNNDAAIPAKRAYAVNGSLYHTITIRFYNDDILGGSATRSVSPAEILVAVPEAYGTSTVITTIVTALASAYAIATPTT